MKKQILLCFFFLFISLTTVFAQQPQTKPSEEKPINAKEEIHYQFIQNQLEITNLTTYGYDRIALLDWRGNILQKQSVNTPVVKMDVSTLDDGVYLLHLRSSATFKEKIIKFAIRK